MNACTFTWCQAFASQLAVFALAAWTLLDGVPGCSGRSDVVDDCSSSSIERFLAYVGLATVCLTNLGLLFWSLLAEEKHGLNLVRFSCLSSASLGLTLSVGEALILQPKHRDGRDNDNGRRDSSMVLACGAVVFFLSCGALMSSFYQADTRIPDSFPESRRSDREVGPETEDESLREPLLAGTQQEESGESDDVERGGGNDDEPPVASSERVDDTPEEETPRWRGTRRLLQLARPQVLYLYAGCFVLLLRLPFSLSIPHFVSTTISAVQDRDFDSAVREIMYLVVAGSIDAALDFWCVFLFGYANLRIVKSLRLDLFRKLIRQEVSFFDKTSSGELSSRLQSDCSEMAGDLTWFFRFSIESVVRIVGITVYMFLRNPLLASCALSIAPVVAVVNKLYGNWLRDNATQVQAALASANVVALEALVNIRTVIAFSAEPFESERYQERIQDHYRLNVKQLYMTGVYYMAISTFLINTIVQALLLYVGSRLVQADRLTPAVLLAFMLYQGQLQSETLNLFQSYSSLIKSSGAGDKVFQLLDRTPPPPSMDSDAVRQHFDNHDEGNARQADDDYDGEGDCVSPSRRPYSVELRGVSFTYPTRRNQPVLEDVNLVLSPGRSLAIVGPSGSGKSTICHLLQRFYDPSSGKVLVDGVDLRQLDLVSYRRALGVVNQETSLFRGTVLENIQYGCPDATRDDAVAAARLAFADEFITDFPDGYDTVIGERGVQLSGGQRQRISIARAILKKPSLLLLDEATSALDGASEHAVQKALDGLLRERSMTTVIVAHRLKTVQRADCIAVLRDGRVAELGSHDELMRAPSGGLYRAMVDRAGPSGLLPDPTEGDVTESASPSSSALRTRAKRRSYTDKPTGSSPRSGRRGHGRVDKDIQEAIQRLDGAAHNQVRKETTGDESSGDDEPPPLLPNDGVHGRGHDSSPFAEYWLRHPGDNGPTATENHRTRSGRAAADGIGTRSLTLLGSRDESVDSVLDATIDSLLDDEEGGGGDDLLSP